MSLQEQVVSRRKAEVHEGLRGYMNRVYGYMAAGLGISGLVAYAASTSLVLMQALFGSPLRWVVMLAPILVVLMIPTMMSRLSSSGVCLCFAGYASLVGLQLSYIFLVYTHESVAATFGIAACMFLGMSLYGYTTKKDLSEMGSFLIMGVLGLIIATMVNMFLKSSPMAYVLSFLGVAIFTGLTAYDAQRIRLIYSETDGMETLQKKALLGALNLYLDFVNMFLYLLRIFGGRRSS